MSIYSHHSMTNHHGSGFLAQLGETFHVWGERWRQRRELAEWTERDLHDVGLSRSDIAGELETIAVIGVAGFADDSLKTVDGHGRDHAEPVVLTGMGEVRQQVFRQLAHGAEETVIARPGRQRPEIGLQRLGIAGLDKPHGQRVAIAQPQDIGMLPEIVETKHGHG